MPALADQPAVVKTERRLVLERCRQEIVEVVEGRQVADGLGDRARGDRRGEPPDVLERSEAPAEADQIAGVGLA